MAKKNEGNYVSVAGKISTWSYGRIMRIMKKLNLTIYVMIQNMCDCIVRYMDDKHNLTPDLEKALSMFEHMIGWQDNFNLADPSTQPEVSEATYYLVDSKGKKGVRVVHVERPFFGTWTQNFNVQQILERFLCLTFQSLYRRLRYIAVCRDCKSILELLTEIVGELEKEEDKKELTKPFEDANRAENNKAVEYGARTKRKHHKDPYFQELNTQKDEELQPDEKFDYSGISTE